MSPADRGLQIPERKDAPVVDDPAVVAGKEAKEAAAAWTTYAKAHPTLADEKTPEYEAIKERSEKADDAFSDAPVTSLAGALVKLRALGKDITEDSGSAAWQMGHVKTVAAFLEGFAGAAQAEPLVALWTERNRLVALCCAADIDSEIDQLGDELSAIEHQIANTEARTLAGVVLQIKLRESVLGHDAWVLSADLTRNVIKALERMAGVS